MRRATMSAAALVGCCELTDMGPQELGAFLVEDERPLIGGGQIGGHHRRIAEIVLRQRARAG
jgi:hypothetical protein